MLTRRHLTIWRPVLSTFPEHKVSAWFLLSVLNSFRGCEGQRFNLCRGSSECWFSVGRAPSQPQADHGLGSVAILPHGARNASSQVCQRLHSWAIQCAVSGPGPWAAKASGPHLPYWPLGPGKQSLLLLLLISAATLLQSLISYGTVAHRFLRGSVTHLVM